ncbi:hypothetical protein MXB_4711, partial [Myxobolus squamalis]
NESKVLRQIIEEKVHTICVLNSDCVENKREIGRLKIKIQSLEWNQERSLVSEIDLDEWQTTFNDQQCRHSKLVNKYQRLLSDNISLKHKIDQILFFKNENVSLKETINLLKTEISEHLKTIFNLKVDLRRTPPQESLQFQADWEKMRLNFQSIFGPQKKIKDELEN